MSVYCLAYNVSIDANRVHLLSFFQGILKRAMEEATMEEVRSKNKPLSDPEGVRGSLKSPPRNIVLKYLIKMK